MERYNGKKKKLKISNITLRNKIDYYLKKGRKEVSPAFKKSGMEQFFFLQHRGWEEEEGKRGDGNLGFFVSGRFRSSI